MSGTLYFTVDGPPRPKERARAGKGGRHYTPPATREYEAHVKQCAWVAAVRQHWPKPAKGGSYGLTVRMCFPTRRRCDLSNVLKAIEDGCNGVVWHDDSEIDSLHVVRLPADKARARVEVDVVRMEEA